MKSLKSQLAEKHQRLSEIDSELKTVSKLAQRSAKSTLATHIVAFGFYSPKVELE